MAPARGKGDTKDEEDYLAGEKYVIISIHRVWSEPND